MTRDLDYSDIGSYLVSISKRIAALEVDFVEMVDFVDERKDKVTKVNNNFKSDLTNLRAEMNSLRWEASDLNKLVDEAILHFNRTLRKSKFERLVRRVEDFSPEDLATYKGMERALKARKS